MAPDEILVIDIGIVAQILDNKGTFTKANIYSVFEGHYGKFANLFTIQDEKRHAQCHHVLDSLYSISRVTKIEVVINTLIDELMY